MTAFLVRHCIQNSECTNDPTVREQYGLLSGAVGIFLNLLLFAGKFTAGLLTGAISVTADAFNNLSDAASSVVTFIGFRLAGQKPDADHPFGHGRMEYLSGLVVSLLILLVGVELGKSSVLKILHPDAVDFSWFSVVVLAVSVLIKLWMGRFNRILSRRINSSAMAATAADSMSDAAATASVLLGLLIGHFFSFHIDGWIGLLVTFFILKAGFSSAKDTLDPLLGQPADPDLVASIEQTILLHPQILGVHDLVLHDYGPGRRMMSVHAEIAADSDLLEAHDIIDHVERELSDIYHLSAVIHMDPIAQNDPVTLQLHQTVAELVTAIHPDITIHDFRVTPGPLLTNLIFDAVVPYHSGMTDDAVRSAIMTQIKTLGENYYAVVNIDRSYVR